MMIDAIALTLLQLIGFLNEGFWRKYERPKAEIVALSSKPPSMKAPFANPLYCNDRTAIDASKAEKSCNAYAPYSDNISSMRFSVLDNLIFSINPLLV